MKAMAGTGPTPREGVMNISAYVPGGHSVEGHAKPIVLSANETPLGASPAAVAAYNALADKLYRYPDGSSTELREAIASALSEFDGMAGNDIRAARRRKYLDIGEQL